ncbi:MAG: DUF1343 domain-containing protein [bacterium]|nr:DUF1343 domain-containing protein [bacterium]
MVITGLDQIRRTPPSLLESRRVGLLVHPASVDSGLMHARHIFSRLLGTHLIALFSPQHGFHGEQQDNMVESQDTFDSELKIPVFSLYSHTRQPASHMFDGLDTLVIDLQDVGTRVYTFIYTMAYCMMAARKCGINVVVLDRPNPVGGLAVEGNLLHPDYASFVGLFPIPMRHGMTIGELALLFNKEFEIGCELHVVPMENWERGMYFEDTRLPWVLPSPNLPTPETAVVYPGQVLLEGTNVSEGRGTTRPFEIFGAPFIETRALAKMLESRRLEGVCFRDHHFIPTFQKWAGVLCHGFQVHVTERSLFRPYRTTLAIIQSIMSLHGDRFQWRSPPYEYEEENLPIDILTGDPQVRTGLSRGEKLGEMEARWRRDLDAFLEVRQNYLLYPN